MERNSLGAFRGVLCPFQQIVRSALAGRPELILEAFKRVQAATWKSCVTVSHWPDFSLLTLTLWKVTDHQEVRNCVDQRPQQQHSQTQTRISTITLSELSPFKESKAPGRYTVSHDLNLPTKIFSPQSHSNVQAVEIWCPRHRKAPCSHSHNLPPPQFQRSGRWALRRSLSLPRSPTDSQNHLGSCCPQTGHVKTGPWFWLQPSGDLHTLKGKRNIWWEDCRC